MLLRASGEFSGEVLDLNAINGEQLADCGVPHAGLLVRFAGEGAIEAPGGSAALLDLDFGEEDSMESAMEALDANDDQNALSSALDRVLGGDDDDGFSF